MSFYVGRRLSYEGNLCTVRYIGTVTGTKGEWLGIEWDDPGRGKHDGEREGIRYFSCHSNSPTAASFVRPTRPADQPLSFLDAVRKKYVAADDMQASASVEKAVYFNGKLAEEVGFDKIRRQLAALQNLEIVILDEHVLAGVKSIPWMIDSEEGQWKYAVGEIRSTCSSIRQLDLSRNVLETFMDIAGICTALPNLIELNLSHNRFRDLHISHDLVNDNEALFQGIRELALDSTGLSWTDILKIAEHFPDLKSLSVQASGLMEASHPLPDTLTSLSLSNNDFKSLSSISCLAALPKLNSLHLASCPLARLQNDREVIFPSVTILDVWKTKLTFDDLGNLPQHFPALKSLRCSTTNQNESLILIARFGTLTVLNYSTIAASLRTNAELYYLSSIAKELGSLPANEEQRVLSNHPRWHELCRIHGEPAIVRQGTSSGGGPNILATRFITFTCHDARKDVSAEMQAGHPHDFEIKLPRSFSIYRVYAHVAERLGALPLYIKIVWETDEWDPVSLGMQGRNKWISPFAKHNALNNDRSSPGKGEDDNEDAWSVSSSDGDDEAVTQGHRVPKRGDWVKREVELVPGPREVGFWVDGKEARLRIESSQHAPP